MVKLPLHFFFNLHAVKFTLFDVELNVVVQSCLTLCDPMDCSMPGFPVHHQLPESAQTHVPRVGDAIYTKPASVSTSISDATFFIICVHG